jgi:hypothetical protein
MSRFPKLMYHKGKRKYRNGIALLSFVPLTSLSLLGRGLGEGHECIVTGLFTPFVPLTFILSPEGRGNFEE